MSGPDLGYLFGCCAACRAPFQPSQALTPEEQSVLYMMSKFQTLSATGPVSGFTGKLEKSHLVARAKYSGALQFAVDTPADRVATGLPGHGAALDWSARSGAFHGSAAAGKRASEVDPDEIVRDAEADAADGSDPAQVARAAVAEALQSTGSRYMALWGDPMTDASHAKLGEWASAVPLNPVSVDVERTTACCSLCNDIWDCWARMRHTMQRQLIPREAISVKYKGKVKRFPNDEDGAMNMRLGCTVAYYLHACLRNMREAYSGQDKNFVFEPARRQVTVMLLWLPLHANCMYQELRGPLLAGTRPAKGFHNYVGCLDLLISYYAYLCACADPDFANFGSFPFEKFHVFYLKELAECPPPAWPNRQRYPRLHDFVFDEAYPQSGHYSAQVGHASDRLQELYHGVVKGLLGLMRGDPAPQLATAEKFFIGAEEAQALAEDFAWGGAQVIQSIRPHLGRVGIHAIMWQLRRSLNREPPQFSAELDKWISARMQVEWRNMAASGSVETLAQAQLVYYAQHTADPGLPAISLGGDEDEDEAGEAVIETLRVRGRCSIWKAAARLRAYHFTTVPRAEPAEFYEVDDAADDLSARVGRLRISFISPTLRALRGATARTSAGEPAWTGSAAAGTRWPRDAAAPRASTPLAVSRASSFSAESRASTPLAVSRASSFSAESRASTSLAARADFAGAGGPPASAGKSARRGAGAARGGALGAAAAP